eukprot:6974402-Prymnesium_polylepis.1
MRDRIMNSIVASMTLACDCGTDVGADPLPSFLVRGGVAERTQPTTFGRYRKKRGASRMSSRWGAWREGPKRA